MGSRLNSSCASRRTPKGLRLARTTKEIEIMSDIKTPPAGASSPAPAGSATGAKSAITYVGSGTKGPHVIYLAEGKRITVGRDKSTKGPAWLVIEDTPVVKAQSPNSGMNDGQSQ